MSRKIALLVSDNLMPSAGNMREDVHEFDEEYATLAPAFAAMGLELVVVPWRNIALRAAEFEAVLPLLVWDYFEGNETEFMMQMARVEAQTKLFNAFSILQWNANKSYLDDLAQRGAAVIPAITVERISEKNVQAAFDTLGTDTLVIKPQVGGGAWRQVLYRRGDPFPPKSELPPQAALIQDFLPSVQEEGEYSFLYFGGEFSHAVLKQAKAGDYRIQSLYGGRESEHTPSRSDKDAARAILDVLDFVPLYARVDLLRGRDGALKLIELELIEPYLYLPQAKGIGAENLGAQKFVKALLKRLDKTA